MSVPARKITLSVHGVAATAPHVCGWGAVLKSEAETGHVQRRAIGGSVAGETPQRMHLRAAVEALKAMKTHDQPTTVRSREQYLVEGMKLWLPQWKMADWRTAGGKRVLNRDMWEQLDQLSQLFTSIKWVRVPEDRIDKDLAEAISQAKSASRGEP